MTTQEVIQAWTVEENNCKPRNDYYFNLHNGASDIQTKSRIHDQYLLMSLGRKLPGTKTHAKFWLKNECIFDVVSTHDILPLLCYADTIKFTPCYRFTKSKSFARLTNHEQLNDCIRKHFNL